MAPVDPHILGLTSVLSGVAFAMVWLGARLNMLEARRASRRCPSCGLVVQRGVACHCRD